MPDLDALVAALAAAPDDRALQGVFADALLERRGIELVRGELVHVERGLAADKTSEVLARRAEALRDRVVADYAARQITQLTFAQGFCVAWVCELDNFVAHAASLFAAEPLLAQVAIRLPGKATTKKLRGAFAVAELARVRHLKVIGSPYHAARMGAEGVRLLVDGGRATALVGLDLERCALRDHGAEVLAEAPCLATLERLALANNDIGTRGTIALANSPVLRALRRLELAGNYPGTVGVAAIAATETLARLEHIDLQFCSLPRAACAAIEARFGAAALIAPTY